MSPGGKAQHRHLIGPGVPVPGVFPDQRQGAEGLGQGRLPHWLRVLLVPDGVVQKEGVKARGKEFKGHRLPLPAHQLPVAAAGDDQNRRPGPPGGVAELGVVVIAGEPASLGGKGGRLHLLHSAAPSAGKSSRTFSATASASRRWESSSQWRPSASLGWA